MNRKNNWVIDADIARSAGETEHPFSKNCRLFLSEIKSLEKKVCFNDKLKDEWNKHKSIYAKKWLASMYARRKVELYKPNITLCSAVEESHLSINEKKIAIKDLHLVELSCYLDKTIASGDDKARLVFVKLTKESKIINRIIWINPKKDGNKIISKLNVKLSDNSDCYLCNN